MLPNETAGLPADVGMADVDNETAAAYEHYSAELLAYAMSITQSQELAMDAVQETFLRYFIERKYRRHIYNVRAWLRRVLRNFLLDRVTSASYRYETTAEGLREVPGANHDPESLLRHCQTAAEMASALTTREMECLQLRAEGRSYQEIATELGIRPGTVSALLTRVHKKLEGSLYREDGPKPDTGPALWLLLQGGENYSA